MPHTHTHAGLIKSIINSLPGESQREAFSSAKTTQFNFHHFHPRQSTVAPLTLSLHLTYYRPSEESGRSTFVPLVFLQLMLLLVVHRVTQGQY